MQKVLLTHIYQIFAKNSGFEKVWVVFWNYPSFSRRISFFELLEFSWAIVLFKTQARRKILRFPILEKSKIYSKTRSISPKNPKIWSFWEFLSNLKIWNAFSIKNAGECSWSLSRIFSQKTFFFGKTQVLNVWRLHKQK